MPIHTTQIGKYKFVCGLFWQSLSRPREFGTEAAALAKKIDCDLVVLRRNQVAAQAGFAHTAEGAKAHTYSLGAAISETLSLQGVNYDGEVQPAHNWLGAFKLPDGMWAYFAVRDANFLPNGDFAGTRETVIERLMVDYSMGGWNIVIGDGELAEHGFHNFIAKPIEALLPQRKNGQIKIHKAWILRPVTRKVPWLHLAAASLTVLIVIAAMVYWHQKRKAEAERQRAIEAAALAAQGRALPPAIPHPWQSKPVPLEMAKACVERLTDITAGGWLLEQYVCTSSQANTIWTRSMSTMEFLKAAVPDAVIDIGGNSATRTVPLQLRTGRDETLQKTTELLQPLISRMQLLGIRSQFARDPRAAGLNDANGAAKTGVPQPDWQTYSFIINGDGLPPLELAALLDLPGIRLERLTYKGGTWIFEGVIYAK